MALEPDPSFMVNNPNHRPINDDHHIGLPQIIDAFDEPLQVFFIFLYTMTAVLALGGNITAIWVLMVGKRSSRDLRTFLVNLALSDVAMALFSIPFTYTSYMLDRWIFHPLFCPFVQFMTCLSVFVSVYTLIAIGIDRYFAIMNPLNCARWTKARSRLIVIFIWIVGTALSSSQLMVSKAMPAIGPDNSTIYQCRELWESVWAERTYTAMIFCITFALPMSILMFTYTSIGWKMLHHTTPGNANTARDIAQFEAKMKVVKMLAVVVVLFILCWLPLHIFNVLYWFDAPIFPPTDSGRRWQNAIFFLCHWLAMANSFLNPIVYCFMSDNFRTDLRHIFGKCCPKYRGGLIKQQSTRMDSTICESSFKTTTFLLKQGSLMSQKNHINSSMNGETSTTIIRNSPPNSCVNTMVVSPLLQSEY